MTFRINQKKTYATNVNRLRLAENGQSLGDNVIEGLPRLDFYDERPAEDTTPKFVGWKPPKPYFRRVHDCKKPYGYTQGKIGSRFLYEEQGALPSFDFLPLRHDLNNDPDLATKALTDAMQSIKDGSFNAAQALAEAGEAARTMGELGVRTADFLGSLRDLRKGRFTDAAQNFRDFANGRGWKKRNRELANRWLEYRYGIQPVVNDVTGAAEALAKSLYEDKFVVTGKGSASTKSNSVAYYQTARNSFSISHSEFDGAFVRLDFVLANNALAQAKALGLTNPISLAYELVPFSFVFDWFVPVGDFLSCLDYSLGLDFLSGSLSRKIEKKSNLMPENHLNYEPFYTVLWDKCETRSMLMDRIKYDDAPSPPLPPFLPGGGGFKRLADGLALLTGVLKK